MLAGSLLLPLALATTGCSRTSDNYADAGRVPAKEARAAAAIDRAAAAEGAHAAERQGLPVAPAPATAARDRALPTAFQGYWGATPNDCELANTEARGRIEIDTDTIRLWETKARVERLVTSSPYRVVADLSLSGPDARWKARSTLALEAGGTTLIRTDAGERAVTVRYQKC